MSYKIALITGASRGLGREIALSLAKEGTHVLFTYHSNEKKAQTVVSEIEQLGSKAYPFQYDASNLGSVKNLVTQLTAFLQQRERSNLDFLINNAGTYLAESIERTQEIDFDNMINIHLKSTYFLTQALLPFLSEGGSIINISSGLTRFSFPGSSAYAMAKGAIEVFTRYLAKELANRKITANVVAPGAIATDFGGGSNRDDQEKKAIISSVTALGRVGEPEDIGGIIAFLCSDKANWINGQRIEASGGMFL